ncbi:MAG: DUF167 domain-containing protein [Pseudomonadales bacterium]|nr:DUF167 domain-containing protein [Pseudomonadales bacterium]
MSAHYRWEGDRLLLSVRLTPRAGHSRIIGPVEGALRVGIAAAPVDGAANAELLLLLASCFAVPKSRVALPLGDRSRSKQLAIERPQQLPAEAEIKVQ